MGVRQRHIGGGAELEEDDVGVYTSALHRTRHWSRPPTAYARSSLPFPAAAYRQR